MKELLNFLEIHEGVVTIAGILVTSKKMKELTIPKSVKQIGTLGSCEIDKLIFLGEDITIGYEAWAGYWHDPFETNNIQATTIKASKTILEKLKESYGYAADEIKFIEI